MSKDALPTAADQPGVSLFREIIRSKTWKRAFLFGAMAGPILGVLNIAAVAVVWPLQWLFGALNYPIISDFGDPGYYQWFYQPFRHGWSLRNHGGYLLLAFICYWTSISLVLAPVYCFVRAGVIRRIRCDQTCRAAMILGAGAGVLIGGLNFLAALDVDGPLANCFRFLDRPGVALAQVAMYRLGLFEILQDARKELICDLVLGIAYWMTIGLLFATTFSFVRVLRMRSDATEVTVSGIRLPGGAGGLI